MSANPGRLGIFFHPKGANRTAQGFSPGWLQAQERPERAADVLELCNRESVIRQSDIGTIQLGDCIFETHYLHQERYRLGRPFRAEALVTLSQG